MMEEMQMPNPAETKANAETMKKRIEYFKKHSKTCVLCGKPSFVDGCEIQLVAITETGKVMDPFGTKDTRQAVIVPLCAYHMVISSGGLIAITTQNRFIQSKILTNLEPQSDEELKRLILKLGRAEKTELNKACKHAAKTIIDARKFQFEMDKSIQERQNGQD